MVAPLRNIAAGANYGFLGFLDEYGYLTGSTPSAPSSGATGSGMMRILGIKSASPTTPEPEVTQVTGDDGLQGEFAFDSIASRAFIIDVAVNDLALNAALQNTNVQTWGMVKVGALDIVGAPEYDACLIFQSRAKSKDDGTGGKKAWSGVLVPLATVKPLGRVGFDERGEAVYRFHVTPQMASYDPNGVTIATANAGTTGLRYHDFNSEYPVTMHRWVGTGAVAAFNLDYTPISAARVMMHANRVALTVNSVDTAAKTATVSAAPAASAAVVGFYEFAG